MKWTLLILISCRLAAQNDSLPFICDSLNIIQHAQGLNQFILSLNQLKEGKVSEINIVHIGDSHVQAGFYSEPIRKELQVKYGNGGRGLVFPYQAAKTNGPSDYSFGSIQPWKSTRNCITKGNLPTGIAGHSIYNQLKFSSINFKPRDKNLIGRAKEVEIYHLSTADSNFAYKVTDSLGNKIGKIDSIRSNVEKSVFTIENPIYNWSIKPELGIPTGKSSTILGVKLTNQSGLIMHTIGVNGAEYEHYLRSKLFNNQLQYLKPDLIILSLGTNEAYNTKDFDPIKFETKVDSFLVLLIKNNPKASILITSPPSIGQAIVTRGKKNRKTYQYVENKNIPIICSILDSLAIKHQRSFWNFYQVMGGYNSINKWYAKGLTDKRRIHFSKKGYLIQGGLLMRALNAEIIKGPK